MPRLGMGALLHRLCGGYGNRPEPYYGMVLSTISLNEDRDRIAITFTNGRSIWIYDNGQSCCEHRYISTDDPLDDLAGGELIKIEIKRVTDDESSEYDCVHEICFLEIATTKAAAVFSFHNEHNGYYGGFAMTIAEDRETSDAG